MAEHVPGSWANGGELSKNDGSLMQEMPVSEPEPEQERKPPRPKPGCPQCTDKVPCPLHDPARIAAGLPDLHKDRDDHVRWSMDLHKPTVERYA